LIKRKARQTSEISPEDIPMKPGIYGRYVRTIEGKLVDTKPKS